MVHFALAVRLHVQAVPCLILVCCYSGAATAFVCLGEECCHYCRLGGDGRRKLLHNYLDLLRFLVCSCSHRAFRIIGSVSKDGLAIYAGLKLFDALSL